MTRRALSRPTSVIPAAARNVSSSLALLLLIATLALITVSCGGGGGGGSVSPPPPPPPPVTTPLSIVTASVPDSQVGQTISFGIQVTGGTAPYTLSLAAGSAALPPGLTMSPTGNVSGSLFQLGTFTFTVEVRDAAAHTATRTFSMRITHDLQVETLSIPGTTAGASYSATISASGGILPHTWSLVVGAGTPPPGLNLDASTGTLSGTIAANTTPGSYFFNARATDSSTPPQVQSGSFDIRVVTSLTAFHGAMPLGVVGQPYQQRIWTAGGTPPITFTPTPNNLPVGMTFNTTTGEISGTPQTEGFITVGADVRDSSNPQQVANGFGQFTIRPALTISNPSLPDLAQGLSTNTTIMVDGGRPPMSLQIASGSLPPGIQLVARDPIGGRFDFSGTATQVGNYPLTIEATDSSSPPGVVTKAFSVRVNSQMMVTNATSFLPPGIEGAPFSFTYQVTGGVPPYTWRCFSCTLPPGLTFDLATGSVQGTPTQAANETLSSDVSDSSNPPQRIFLQSGVFIAGLLKATPQIPPLIVGQPVRIQLASRGGFSPLQWSLLSGTLPAGLSFNASTAEISGTPSVIGSQTFTVRLRDSSPTHPQTLDQMLTLSIVNATGRNDTMGTATPLSMGRYRASLSPFGDPGAPGADLDFYKITADAGTVVIVEIFADQLAPVSPMDSVLEILDAGGVRLNTCSVSDSGPYVDMCLNDDGPFGTLDSRLAIRVPGAAASVTTLYLRVLDWSGNARPDFIYEIKISGSN